MGLKDVFNASKIKEENEKLKKLIEELNADQLVSVQEKISEGENELVKLEKEKNKIDGKITKLNNSIDKKKKQIIVLDEDILFESFALYKPKYNFLNSDDYKDKLYNIRQSQKDLIKNKTAVTGNLSWSVNGKASEGRKMVNDMIKLVLRAFNNECDASIIKVKFNNIESCEKRIEKSYEALNKLGKIMQVNISNRYKKLKYEELYLAHEYQVKKQDEKEEQKRLREQLREEAKLAKEIELARKSIYKEQTHYNNALSKLELQLSNTSTEEEKIELQKKIEEIKDKLNEIEKNLKDIDYREANKRAGYVYIISNIGSFGKNIYKIGMTRRLEPLERVHELSDASVPFNFDVHAMIFCNDAPSLENELHKAFEDKKVNMINTRREFFNVTLEEIERVVKSSHDKTVEFTKLASAEQYRQTLKMKA